MGDDVVANVALVAVVGIFALVSLYFLIRFFSLAMKSIGKGRDSFHEWTEYRQWKRDTHWKLLQQEHQRLIDNQGRGNANTPQSPARTPNRSKGLKRSRWRYKQKYSNWRTVANREGYDCHLCGRPVDPGDYRRTRSGQFVAGPDYPTVDHVRPQARGGTHHWTNLKLAHKRCNSRKHTKEDWSDVDFLE